MQDSPLKRALRRANMPVQSVCDVENERFIEGHVQGLEEDLG